VEIDAYILSHCESAHHISGTCRFQVPHLGGADDPLSVCDEEGSVIGVAALRMVDASLMLVRCHCFFSASSLCLHVAGTERNHEFMALCTVGRRTARANRGQHAGDDVYDRGAYRGGDQERRHRGGHRGDGNRQRFRVTRPCIVYDRTVVRV
jgi:hypothetical protein